MLFRSVGLRYFNVFGKRQDPNGAYAAVIPKWVASMIHGQEIFINGDGETSRDFCYVANAVQANLLAANVEGFTSLAQVFNVAVGDRTTLNELFNLLHDCLKSECHLSGITVSPTFREFRAGDVRHSQANIDKAREILGYSPAYKLRAGISQAMPWYVGQGK